LDDRVLVLIEVVTLGGFDIKVDGESVLKKSKRTYKNLELLKYLITFREKKLVPEKIVESLWLQSDI
jgi:two-component SAPR family response regulator